MALRVTVSDAQTGNTVDVNIETWNTAEELIESVASYWGKELAAYVVRLNNYVLRGDTPLGNMQLQGGEAFEFILDPEGG